MVERWIVFGTLVAALALFVRGTWRYDLVALLALLTLCLAGIVPPAAAFLGFGHPAVVTVAAVLIISAALRSSGVVDVLIRGLERVGESRSIQVGALALLVALCSGFMNNVGALAILMPAAIQLARGSRRSPSYLLMPLAFGSLLGGLTTLIGTPSNVIIATIRADVCGAPFAMFDFAYVGVGVALAGILFISLGGWRLIPDRPGDRSAEELFEIDKYTSELRVTKDSKAGGMTIRQIAQEVDAEASIVGLARGKRRVAMPALYETLAADDVLLVEGDAESIKTLADALGLELVGDKELRQELLKSEAIEVSEAIVTPNSYIERRTVAQLNLRRRFGVNLLGVARHGRRLRQRLRDVRLRVGDILLLQGDGQALQEAVSTLGCLPLARRGLRLGQPRRVLIALGLFVAALAAMALGWLPVQIALSSCAAAMVLTKLLTLREAYAAIDWPIIVLLAAMIPVGEALESTGGAQVIATGLLTLSRDLPAAATIAMLLIGTTLLSNAINNAAAAVLMAPLAIRIAEGLSITADPLLMAVALGASSAYLTPIGHQSNTLVLGPGGYRFSDYVRLGLPVTLITWGVGLPLILLFWQPLPATA
ncbi:MAG TPA: SLC13 family permease [Phycisphaerae bacterium]|nr:SLC13 family permease [Phycisphaerae bacterium]HQL53745.1 SLC13 family permease [Phycisphaerae bacterium]